MVKEKTTVKTKEIEAVPSVDINAPLTKPIDESTDYEMAVTPKNRFLYRLGTVGFVIINLLVFSVLYLYLTGFKGKSEDKSVKIEETPVTQTATSFFDKASVTFEVLNGSGVAGAAKEAGSQVEGLGYRVIGTGNAGATKGNKLYLKSNLTEFMDQILSTLGTEFGISTVSGTLTEGSASARLILGTK